MSDFRKRLTELRRPSLLMRAARHGLADYQRGRWLKRLLSAEMPPETALGRLFTADQELEDTRLRGDASYSIVRHIDVLIALLGEARLLSRRAEV